MTNLLLAKTTTTDTCTHAQEAGLVSMRRMQDYLHSQSGFKVIKQIKYSGSPVSHRCEDCQKNFSKKSNLLQHRRTHHTTKQLISVKKKTTVKPRKLRPTEKALNTLKKNNH